MTRVILAVCALTVATVAAAGDGQPIEPVPATSPSTSNLINGVLADDYPVINGPEVPPLPTPVDPEYVGHGRSSSGARTPIDGSLAGFGATTAFGGRLAAGGSSRSALGAREPLAEARRSLRQVIRDLE